MKLKSIKFVEEFVNLELLTKYTKKTMTTEDESIEAVDTLIHTVLAETSDGLINVTDLTIKQILERI